jgi:hypothetical protein
MKKAASRSKLLELIALMILDCFLKPLRGSPTKSMPWAVSAGAGYHSDTLGRDFDGVCWSRWRLFVQLTGRILLAFKIGGRGLGEGEEFVEG